MSDKATPRPWVIWEGPSYVGGGADLCIGAGENWLFNMDHRHCEARPHHWGLCDCKPEGDIQIASGPEGKVCPGGDCKHEDCITAEQRANAELIVSAVNAYEAHQRAAQALREYHKANRLHHDEDARLYELSEAALADLDKLEGRP